MFDRLRPRHARISKRLSKRRLGAELLESRSLLSAVPTPAAIDAESLAMAEQASSPTAAPSTSTAATASNQAAVSNQTTSDNTQTFVTNAYRALLGRDPSNSELQYWQGFFTANNAPTQSTGSGGVGTALTGAPVGGYSLSEYPGSTGANDPVPVAPTSGTGIGTREFDADTMGSSETAYPNGAGPLTTGDNAGVTGASPGGTLPTAPVSSQAGAESVNSATQATDSAAAQFVQAVLASPEYQQRVVTQVYEEFLHRAPNNDALTFWSAQLGATGERSMIVNVLSSPEYFQDAGGTAAGYVDALYRDVLGRPASRQESAAWVSQLNTDGGGAAARAMVASDILDSPEASALLINNPTTSALASLTGGGYNQNLFQGGLAAAEQESYAAALGDDRAFESVIESMVAANQSYMYQTGPGPMENPGYPSANLGSTSG